MASRQQASQLTIDIYKLVTLEAWTDSRNLWHSCLLCQQTDTERKSSLEIWRKPNHLNCRRRHVHGNPNKFESSGPPLLPQEGRDANKMKLIVQVTVWNIAVWNLGCPLQTTNHFNIQPTRSTTGRSFQRALQMSPPSCWVKRHPLALHLRWLDVHRHQSWEAPIRWHFLRRFRRGDSAKPVLGGSVAKMRWIEVLGTSR